MTQLPVPPYYAVIFTSTLATASEEYLSMASKMEKGAATISGFLGMRSARDANGFGITVSYWQTQEAIAEWKANADHLVAQKMGRSKWYEHFEIHITRVEKSYAFGKS